MRIGLVLWSGQFGGAETFTAALAAELLSQQHDVQLLFVTSGSPLNKRLDLDRVPWRELGLSRGRRVLGATRLLARQFANVDIVLLPSSGYLAAAIRLGGYRGGIVSVEHSGALIDPGTRSGLMRAVRLRDELLGMWAVDAQVAVSDALARCLKVRRNSRLIEVIHNGVRLPAFLGRSRDHEVPIVGAAGRLVAGKGFPELLAALIPLVKMGKVDLRVAGEGPLGDGLKNQCAEAGVDSAGIMLGRQSNMQSFWHSCDIGVVPSNETVEAFGMVAIEAMAAGIPVVATSQPALSQIVSDGVAGALVPPGDIEAMRAAVARYADDADLRTKHGVAARDRVVADYDIKTCAKQYIQLFDRVLTERWTGSS